MIQKKVNQKEEDLSEGLFYDESQLQPTIDAIEKFAQEHNLVLNPHKRLGEHAMQVIKYSGCPCRRGRPACPCEQSLREVEDMGFCACRLLLTEEYFNKNIVH